ncbi:MAG: universal stress protein [Acidimicrobiia bacterium]
MDVLIATSGALSPEPAARLGARLAGEDGAVHVVTVIEVPRSFLDEIHVDEWHPLDESEPRGTHEDAVIGRYVEERGKRITDPLLAALRGLGLETTATFLEGEDPAKTIYEAAVRLEADVIILGATRPIFEESSWESVSMRVVQEGTIPVLIVPALPRQPEDEDDA